MRNCRWLWLLIVLVFGATLFLAVAKVRAPQVKFDRITLGMDEELLGRIMGRKPDGIWFSASYDGRKILQYGSGLHQIDVMVGDKGVESKLICFVPPSILSQRPATAPTGTPTLPLLQPPAK